MSRPICLIAKEIELKWRKPFGQQYLSGVSCDARPYLDAMKQLNHINETFYREHAKDIILRFLANAATWRGEDARRIKQELRELVK